MGCLGIVILLVSGVRADKPAVVASVSDRSLGDDLFKQIRIYFSKAEYRFDARGNACEAIVGSVEDEKLSDVP